MFGVSVLVVAVAGGAFFVLSSRLAPAAAYRKTSVDAVMKDTFDANAEYRNPGFQQWTRMKATTTLLLQALASPNPSWSAVDLNAEAVGFELTRIENSGQRYVVLKERPKQKAGGGVYFFREPTVSGSESSPLSSSRVLIVEAPHAIYDRYTGPIARSIFEGAQGTAFCVNTAPRYADTSRQKLSDLAHNTGAFFQAVHEALCDYYDKALIVQIHGFDRAKTETDRSKLHVILSDGTPNAAKNPMIAEIAKKLENVFDPSKIAIFGDEVDELGATTNVQGQYINRRSDDVFVHIELSAEARKALMEKTALRKKFVEAFR